MDRRSFLKTSAFGGTAAAASSVAAPAIAQGKVTLTMVTSWPRGLAGVWDAAERFATNVSNLSGGQLEIDLKAAGELVGALEVFDAVAAGQADMYHSPDYYYIGQHPAFAFFTTVPFGMTAPEMMIWYYQDGGMEKHHMLGEIFGVKGFLAGNTSSQGGGWFRQPINSVDDFQGLKFRMPGLGAQVLSKMGASVQVLPGGEIYQALSTGALDGTEWIGPWSDEKLGLQEVCDYYYPASFHEPGAAITAGVNLSVFENLDPMHQKIIEIAAAETHQHNYTLFMSQNAPALQRLRQGGTQIMKFPDEVWDAFGSASKEVLDGFMDDELFVEIRESHDASLAASADWMQNSDNVYTSQRNRVNG